jgi:hypothetical protein
MEKDNKKVAKNEVVYGSIEQRNVSVGDCEVNRNSCYVSPIFQNDWIHYIPDYFQSILSIFAINFRANSFFWFKNSSWSYRECMVNKKLLSFDELYKKDRYANANPNFPVGGIFVISFSFNVL